MTPNLKHNPAENAKPAAVDTVYQVAAGLLSQDRHVLVWFYLILVLPSFLGFLFYDVSLYSFYAVVFIRMLCVFLVLYLVGERWIRRLSAQKAPRSFKSYGRLALAGFGVWLPLMILGNSLVSAPIPSRGLQFLCIVLLIPALSHLLRYYFFFVPALLNITGVRSIMAVSRFYTLFDKWMPLRVLVAPFAAECLIVSLAQIVSPDGRLVLVDWLVAACGGVFWLLSTYLGMAFAMMYMEERLWHEHHLDPYRIPRLQTLAVQGPSWAAKMLRPRAGLSLLLLAILVSLGNVASLLTTPPAASFTVESIHVKDGTVILELSLTDQEYFFRGFYPQYLRLAGKDRAEIAPFPKEILVDGKPFGAEGLAANKHTGTLKISAEFETNRPTSGLRDLEDLYLWYLASRLVPLDMKNAAIDK